MVELGEMKVLWPSSLWICLKENYPFELYFERGTKNNSVLEDESFSTTSSYINIKTESENSEEESNVKMDTNIGFYYNIKFS